MVAIRRAGHRWRGYDTPPQHMMRPSCFLRRYRTWPLFPTPPPASTGPGPHGKPHTPPGLYDLRAVEARRLQGTKEGACLSIIAGLHQLSQQREVVEGIEAEWGAELKLDRLLCLKFSSLSLFPTESRSPASSHRSTVHGDRETIRRATTMRTKEGCRGLVQKRR